MQRKPGSWNRRSVSVALQLFNDLSIQGLTSWDRALLIETMRTTLNSEGVALFKEAIEPKESAYIAASEGRVLSLANKETASETGGAREEGGGLATSRPRSPPAKSSPKSSPETWIRPRRSSSYKRPPRQPMPVSGGGRGRASLHIEEMDDDWIKQISPLTSAHHRRRQLRRASMSYKQDKDGTRTVLESSTGRIVVVDVPTEAQKTLRTRWSNAFKKAKSVIILARACDQTRDDDGQRI